MRKIAITSAVLGLTGVGLVTAPIQGLSAQAWIGQVVGDMMAQQAAAEERHRCYMGNSMEEAEVTEAFAPTNARMQEYFTALQSGSGTALDHFAVDKKARWISGETTHKQETLASAADPFAAAGMTIDTEPAAYVRSGMAALTHAQWQVRDADGALVGTYSGFFVRKLGDWKMRTLTLTPATEYVEPVVQFCMEPGDVMPYRLDHTERNRTWLEQSVAKAEEKLAKRQAKLAAAEAKLSEKPESSSRQSRVAKAQKDVTKWEGKLAERQESLSKIVVEYDSARADAAKAEVEKEAAMAALAAANGSGADAAAME